MSWTTPTDVKAKLQKSWDRGELLSCTVSGDKAFPREIRLKAPTAAEITDRFDDVRKWAAQIRQMPHCRVENKEINHRLFGRNSLPSSIWLDTVEDALTLIGQRRAAKQFEQLVAATREQQPSLLPWLQRRPLAALSFLDEFPQLLSVVAWLQTHPKPNIYIRQVDIPGIDSKFIEAHRGVLSEWLDICLDSNLIDGTASGIAGFARRYGFKEKPTTIRFRVLDCAKRLLPFSGDQDMTLDALSFSNLRPDISQIFITENEVNYLAFPELPDAIVIFGSGYGFDALSKADWLLERIIHYWGDIDTHGFAILNSLREFFPHAQSLMMDEETLLNHKGMWGSEENQHNAPDFSRLTENELSVYHKLKNQALKNNLRLEQERISWNYAVTAIGKAWAAGFS